MNTLPTFSLTTVLVGYLVTQVAMAIIIYLILASAAKRNLRSLFMGAGREYYTKGFDEAARASLAALLGELHNKSIVANASMVQEIVEAAHTTARDVAATAHATANELATLTATTSAAMAANVEEMRINMRESTSSITALHRKLSEISEQLNVHQP